MAAEENAIMRKIVTFSFGGDESDYDDWSFQFTNLISMKGVEYAAAIMSADSDDTTRTVVKNLMCKLLEQWYYREYQLRDLDQWLQS